MLLSLPRPHRRECSCGWSGSYPTAGIAERSKRRHSCDVDWSPKTCEHGGRHTHGTAAMHKHCGCNCEPCRIAVADARLTSERARAYGRQRYVDADPAREHLRALMAAGMGRGRISALSGIEESMLTRLVIGKVRNGKREYTKRISRATESAILGVTWDPADGGASLDGSETRRRLRALLALGWYPVLLARETGYEQAYIDRLIYDDDRRVRPGTARRIHAIYRRLADAPPPTGPYAARARERAREKGWTPPIRIGGRLIAGQPIQLREGA